MTFRIATIDDVEQIVKLLADDVLGNKRENYKIPLPLKYIEAFKKIASDSNQELIVVLDKEEVIGTMQLSFIQYLTYQGGIRAQIEAVRVRKDRRGEGVGRKMFDWAIRRAKLKKAHVLQLTTDKNRIEALQFYKDVGFINSHDGMKLHL